ncbi:Lrp/AsnC family transcriptional regulator [Streptomyces tubercidicus]
MKSDGKPEAADRGRGTGETGPGGSTGFDGLDHGLIHALQLDGRAPFSRIAAVLGISDQTVARRYTRRRTHGALTDADRRLFYALALWLSVEPARLVAAGEAMAAHPEVGYACATTGPHNLFASVLCRNVGAVYRYLTTRVAALPGVRAMESAPRIRHIKGPGPVFPSPRPAPGRHR